jgi:hypothetical protein
MLLMHATRQYSTGESKMVADQSEFGDYRPEARHT